jgi:hypothetical protein
MNLNIAILISDADSFPFLKMENNFIEKVLTWDLF